MIDTCLTPNCFSAPFNSGKFCRTCSLTMAATNVPDAPVIEVTRQMLGAVAPPEAPKARNGRREADEVKGENSGGDVDYYRVFVADPKRTEPYMAECEDIIEALKMPFADGCAFKAIWRKNAQQALGHMKRGADAHGFRDSEKVAYYGERMKVQAIRLKRKESAEDVRERMVTELQK